MRDNVNWLKRFLIVIIQVKILSCFQYKLLKAQLGSSNALLENQIMSPAVIYNQLSLLSNGATGKTQSTLIKSMSETNLESSNEESKKILSTFNILQNITTKNAIFTSEKPNDDFVKIAGAYNTSATQYSSSEEIKNWFTTNIDPSSTMNIFNSTNDMLIFSSISIKPNWKFNFYAEKKGIFYNGGREPVTVDMMFVSNTFMYYSDKEVQIFEIPYYSEDLKCIFIFPRGGVNFDNLLYDLDEVSLAKYFSQMKYTKMNIYIPKFNLTDSQNVNAMYRTFGLDGMFNKNKAEFNNINSQNPSVTLAVHTVNLEVGSRGVSKNFLPQESIRKKNAIKKEVFVTLNRPFAFMVTSSSLPKANIIFARIESL